MNGRMLIGVFTTLMVAEAPSAFAQCELQELIASDATLSDWLGEAVSLSGDAVLIGAPGDYNSKGAVYAYRFDGVTWVEEAKLIASDGRINDRFGVAVSLSDDVAVIGARGNSDAGPRSGSAYVFRYEGGAWVEEAQLVASEASAEDWFGGAVSVAGNLVVISATGDDDGASMAGAAYIFRWDGVAWSQEAKLTASDPAERDFFGHSVAISAEVALIGLSQDDDADTASGSAYVFRFDGSDWLEEVKLTAPEPVYYGGFGASVSMSGDTLLIGAHSPDPATGPGYGSAYVYRFRRARWVLEAELTASRSPPPGLFGRAVSIDGNLALIGASGDDAAGLNSGSAYLFRFDGAKWNEVAQVTASDAGRMEKFGFGVSVDGGIAVVGAPYHGHPTRANGAAYVLAVNGRDCNSNEQLDVCDIFEGTSNDVDVNAIPDECEPFVTLDVKPRSCPNLLNPKSRGKLTVAIVAAAWFDVTEIDIGSLVLSRSDGVGGGVTPFRGPAGASVRILDVAAPFRGEFCGCNHLTGDRIDDLVLKFSTLDLVEAFDLNTTGSRTEIAVTLGGSLLDQTEFEASDCIVLPGPHAAGAKHRR